MLVCTILTPKYTTIILFFFLKKFKKYGERRKYLNRRIVNSVQMLDRSVKMKVMARFLPTI